MTRTWDELWEGIEWGRVTTIPFITERIHEIKAMGDILKEKAEKYDEENKVAMIVEEELRKINDKLEAVRNWCKAQLGCQVDPQDIRELVEILEASG